MKTFLSLIQNFKSMTIEFYQTFRFQFEFLPRLTVMYGEVRLVAFEWLWFGVVVEFKNKEAEREFFNDEADIPY